MPLERSQAVLQFGSLPAFVKTLGAQVHVAVVGELVVAALDRGDHLGMLIDGISRYVERARYLMPGQQFEHPAEAALGPEPSLREHGQPSAVLRSFATPWRLAVHVERQRDGDLSAIWPARELCARDHNGRPYLGTDPGRVLALRGE